MTKKSIITEDMGHCYLCGGPKECIHHIIYGAGRRKIADQNGFIVPLCNRCHNMSDTSVHFNKTIDRDLKAICQSVYEESHSRVEWMMLVGRNYLYDYPRKKKK